MLGYLEVAPVAQPQKHLATLANPKGLQSVPANKYKNTRYVHIEIRTSHCQALEYSHDSSLAKTSDLESRLGDFEHLSRLALGLLVMPKGIDWASVLECLITQCIRINTLPTRETVASRRSRRSVQ